MPGAVSCARTSANRCRDGALEWDGSSMSAGRREIEDASQTMNRCLHAAGIVRRLGRNTAVCAALAQLSRSGKGLLRRTKIFPTAMSWCEK